MFKLLFTLLIAISLTAVTTTSLLAATVPCTVVEVSGDTATLDCGSKATAFKAGDKVKVKVKGGQTAAIEGC